MRKNAKERFYEKTKTDEKTGCLIWQSCIHPCGYGRFKIKGKTQLAHRVAWVLEYGEIPEDILVLHKCNNRLCVNVKHLKLGTHQDNMNDLVSKNKRIHIIQ